MTSEFVAGYLEETPGARGILLDFARKMLDQDLVDLSNDVLGVPAELVEAQAIRLFLRAVAATVREAVDKSLADGGRACGVCGGTGLTDGYDCPACAGSMVSGI